MERTKEHEFDSATLCCIHCNVPKNIAEDNGILCHGPKVSYESLNKPFSAGLTKEHDIEVKESLMAMQVRFLKRGKNWTLQRIGVDGEIEHILLSTKPVKHAQFYYHDPKD